VLADVPTSYAIPGGESYSPEDYSRQFLGPVSVRTALANSLNVPAVRVLSRVGVPAFLDRLRDLGFNGLRRSPDYYGLGLTLGAGEVSLWDLTHAYVTLARCGSAIPLQTAFGDANAQPAPIGNPDDWKLITDILADRYARARAFGIGSVLDMPFPAAVKTGTSSGYRDTWTVGYTADYTVGVWVGNFNGSPMRRIGGVSGAGPLWNRIMLHLYDRRDPPVFEAPPASLLAASRRKPPLNASESREFDEWRARQNDTSGPLRILFPHDGDTFADTLASSDSRRAEQQLAVRISRPAGTRVRVTVGGIELAQAPGNVFYWTVRPGTWVIEMHGGAGVSRVRFSVIRRAALQKRGFVFAR
jgi:penicillin-binding protein 1C